MSQWLQITSGRGPAECCRVVYQVVQCIKKEAEKYNLEVEVLKIIEGTYPRTFKSALLVLNGEKTNLFCKTWEGTIQWIGQSPFRKHHKRKNWFISVKSLTPPDTFAFSEQDIVFHTMKASGPGGQHVNKSDTAVRVTHSPSKLSAVAQEERSQYLNRKLALARLFALLEQKKNRSKEKFQQNQWDVHNKLERGNPVRIYEGVKFKKTFKIVSS